MKLLNFNFNNNKKEETKIEKDEVFSLSSYINSPIARETNKDWVEYGEDNDYPGFLKNLYTSSPTHQAIISSKSLIALGEGYNYNDTALNAQQKSLLDQILYFVDGKNDMDSFLSDIFFDLFLYGAFCLEIIWSVDRTKWVKVKRISPSNIRAGKIKDNEIKEYFYSRNWADRKEEITPIPAFDVSEKEENPRQLLYISSGNLSNDYYAEPSYSASINWISLEAQTGEYYKSLLDNNFSPSMTVQFFKKPPTEEAKRDIIRGLEQSYGGTKKAGKVMVTFSSNKESAPEIKPIEVSSVDKQYIVLSQEIQSKILTGAKITTPELLGIAVPGKLGNSDFATQVDIFLKFSITPFQRLVENTINNLLFLNGLNVDFKIEPFKIETK